MPLLPKYYSSVFNRDNGWLQLGKDTTKKGVLFPRVLLDSISTKKRGLFVYDLKDSVLYHFDSNRRVRYMTYKDTAFLRTWIPQQFTTNDISEGSNNKYYTDARARAALSGGTGISYNNATGVIDNSGVLSVDGSTGAVDISATYHKQGGNAINTTSVIGNTNNFGINFITNNNTRFSISNIGKGLFSGSTVEDILTVGNDRINKLVLGIGRGSAYTDNMPFILFGGNPAVDPIITSSSGGLNRLDLSRTDVIMVTGSSMSISPELRGGVWAALSGSVFGVGSRANVQGGGHIGTSGTMNWLTVPWHIGTNSDIMPTSGNMAFNVINIDPRINQTGTANGVVRGIYINPTLISAPDFRAIVIANSMGYGIYQFEPNVKNYFNGSVGIKVANPVEALEVNGNIKTAQPSANGAGVFKIGKVITGASVTVQTDKYLEVEIDGVMRKLAIVE